MTFPIKAETVPLNKDANGVIRVGKTRVTLVTVITAFLQGATAEEISYQYPSLNLADVYSVIAYFLKRRATLEAYLQQRQQQSENIQRENENRFDPSGIRERLMARQTIKEQ